MAGNQRFMCLYIILLSSNTSHTFPAEDRFRAIKRTHQGSLCIYENFTRERFTRCFQLGFVCVD